jgi:hypothetical protein
VGRGPTGPVVVDTADGGSTWSTARLPNEFRVPSDALNAIACPSVSRCWAAGSFGRRASGVVIGSADGGRTWATEKLPTGTGMVNDIACAGISECWAAGSDQGLGSPTVLATTDGGKRWNAQSVPGGIGTLNDIACASGSDCWATAAYPDHTGAGGGGVDGAGPAVMLVSTDGGVRWKSAALPDGTTDVLGIGCPTASACWTVGTSSTDVEILVLGATASTLIQGHHRRHRVGGTA